MTKTRIDVLALDGDVNTCVAAVRSLAKAGHRVTVGNPTPSKAEWSRFCTRVFRYPAPQDDVPGFIAAVTRELQQHSSAFVLPMTEPSTLALSANRETVVAAGGRMLLPEHTTLVAGCDKLFTTHLAASLGMATPRTVLLRSEEDAQRAAFEFPLPAVLKARTSEEIAADGKLPLTGGPQYARSREQFMQAFRAVRQHSSNVLAQEFIDGRGAGYFALLHDGELRAECAHLRLREVRPTGSGSSMRMSIAPPAEIRDGSLAMLRKLRFTGVAMVEFKIDRNGRPYFLELNPRLWNSMALAVYAGVDFPVLMAKMAMHGDIAPQSGYRTGVRCRWILGDLRHLLAVTRGRPADYPGEWPSRWRAAREVLCPLRGTYHDPFAISDPLPEIADWLYAARRALARARSSRRTRGAADSQPQSKATIAA